MYYTYVLYSEQFQKTYVGYTSDIEGRLSAHNHPSNKGWTKSYQPWRILFYEEYISQSEAIRKILSGGRLYEQIKCLSYND